MGIAKYNSECRSIVTRYCKEWEQVVNRMGRWIDFQNDYKTMDPSFMESVWWVFKSLFEKDLVYRGYRVMPFSTACSTPLSNFEANLNYKEDTVDPAVVISFPILDADYALLAWTTTPWTLPSNLALFVNPDMDYIKFVDAESGKTFVLLEKLLSTFYKDVSKASFKVVQKMKGLELVGLSYEPLFNYFEEWRERGFFKVYSADYVTDASGTGIVHCAPGFGEEDYRYCVLNGLIKENECVPCPIDDSGRFTEAIKEFAGSNVKEADKEIIKKLKAEGRLLRHSQVTHSYPFCWRSDTPLIYRAVPSWFVKVKDSVPDLLENNKKSRWVPDFVQEKRFHNWLENARDWAISRNRFWGTPIPLWVSEDFEEIVCVGSIAELEELTGVGPIKDIHRESIDHLTIPSRKGKGTLRRVDEVLDCWFESGSMPYAQQHYPFERKESFESSFPADFIAEGLDQTRGWFYTLHVLSTHLFNKPAFKNLIVNGLVLAADGKKMSKRLKNYPEPSIVVDKFGADSLRLYLINSPVVRAESLKFKEEGVKGILKDVLLPWYNAFSFLLSQIDIYEKENNCSFLFQSEIKSENVMDRWILASLQSLIKFVNQEMEAYRLYTVVPRLVDFIELLTNWYVRFNRKRLKGEFGAQDCQIALNSLFEVLFSLCVLMGPFTPFLVETMYQKLKPYRKGNDGADERSVHFLMMPLVNSKYFDASIERAMGRMKSVIEVARTLRESKQLSLKTPLSDLIVICPSEEFKDDLVLLKSYIQDELNVRDARFSTDESKFGVHYKAIPNFKLLGARLKGDFGKVQAAMKNLSSDQLKEFLLKKEIQVAGVVLSEGDLEVSRYIAEAQDGYLVQSEREFILLLNSSIDDSLKEEGWTRDVISKIQKLRKEAGLKATDEVACSLYFKQDPNNDLSNAIEKQMESFRKAFKGQLVIDSSLPTDPLASSEHEVGSAKIQLSLLK